MPATFALASYEEIEADTRVLGVGCYLISGSAGYQGKASLLASRSEALVVFEDFHQFTSNALFERE